MPQLESKPELTESEKNELLNQTIKKREILAESDLNMAKLFIQRGKIEIAKRRIRLIVAEFAGSAAATEAKGMLKKL